MKQAEKGKQVQTEEQLLYFSDRFRTLFEFAPDAFYITDLEGTFIDGNRAAEELVGYTKEELIGKNFISTGLLDEKDMERAINLLDMNSRGLATGPDEFTLNRKDGTGVPIEIRTFPVKLDSQHVVLGIARDMTEHKKKYQANRSAEKHHQLLAGNVTNLVYTMDMDLRFTYVSPTIAEIGNYTVEEVMGLSPEQILKPDSLKAVMKALEEELTLEDVEEVDLYRSRLLSLELIKKDGSTIWLEAVLTFLRDRDGLPCGILGVASPVDGQDREKMLSGQVADQTSNLLSYSPNPILTLYADGSIGYVNAAFEELTGFTASEVIGLKPPFPWWTEENRGMYTGGETSIIRRNGKIFEQQFRSREGRWFWVNITPVRIEARGKLIRYLEYWLDITEQKRLRENMTYYISHITRAQEEERRRMVNELGNNCIQHLSSLSLSIDNLSRNKEQLSTGPINRIKRARGELNGLMDEMRSFLHRLRPVVIDELGLVPALEALVEEIFVDVKTEVSIIVTGKQRRIMPEIEINIFRIAQEILRNTVRHSEAKQAKVRVKFTADKVRLSMSDNGKGFEPPIILREFASDGKLGLIGVEERARLLDAELMIKSRINRGTLVIVEARTGEPVSSSLNI